MTKPYLNANVISKFVSELNLNLLGTDGSHRVQFGYSLSISFCCS